MFLWSFDKEQEEEEEEKRPHLTFSRKKRTRDIKHQTNPGVYV
jgi:hypothetical protein